MSVLRIKPLMLLACWTMSVVEANFITDYFFSNTEEQDLESPEIVKEELIELEDIFGSLRFAFAFQGGRCNDEDFPPGFWDGLTHAAEIAIGQEFGAGAPDGRLIINEKYYKNILHNDGKAMNRGGLIWQHIQGHNRVPQIAPPPTQGKGKGKGGGRRQLHGPDGGPIDNFCESVRRSMMKTRYIECACTGGWCTPPAERRLRGDISNGGDEEDEVVEDVEQPHEEIADADGGHRQLSVERIQFMQQFRGKYPVPMIEFSPVAEEAAARYLRMMMADESETSVYPACFDRNVEPIVFVGMVISA